MKIKKSIATLAGAVCAAALLIAVPAQAQKNSLKITNNSDWTIDKIFLSPVDTDDWGSDWLADNVMPTGTTYLLRGIYCDIYDVKLVDEHGCECEIQKVDFCSGRADWTITSDYLTNCIHTEGG